MATSSPLPEPPSLSLGRRRRGDRRRHDGGLVERRPLGLSVTLWAAIIIFTLLAVFPYLVMLSTMVKSSGELSEPAHWIPNAIDLDGIIRTLQDESIWGYFRNSFIIATGTTLLVMTAAIPAAYALSRFEFRGRKLYLDLVLITQMFSPIVLLIPLFRLYKEVGLLGSLEGVILAGSAFVLPFSIWLLTGFFKGIPVEVEEAARVDGYGRLAILFRIILPLSIPGLVATGMYAFIIGWNEFIFAVTFLIANPDGQPISVGVFASIGKWTIDWQRLMFLALIGTVPVLILFAAIQKQLDRGFASIAGGDK
jgi:multiple sugar transport system permease protein